MFQSRSLGSRSVESPLRARSVDARARRASAQMRAKSQSHGAASAAFALLHEVALPPCCIPLRPSPPPPPPQPVPPLKWGQEGR